VRHSDKEIEISIDAKGSRSHRALEACRVAYGGDEFVALLPEIGRRARRRARRQRASST